jgi:NAD(P)-dependent dehydrogenase (short-subunit alcohol dehydrogenase family)
VVQLPSLLTIASTAELLAADPYRCACRVGLRAAGVPVGLHGDGCLIADVGTTDGNRRMVETAPEHHGQLDILILNAGASQPSPRLLTKEPVSSWVGE